MAGDTASVYKRPPTSLSSSGDAARVPPWTKAHPATLAPEQPLFLIEGRHVPACLPLLLPLLSGDIKTNPGLLTHYNIRCSGGAPTRTHPTGMEMSTLPSLTQHDSSPTLFAFYSPSPCSSSPLSYPSSFPPFLHAQDWESCLGPL